jgi:hypothetical protein
MKTDPVLYAQSVKTWRDLNVMANSSADALGAIVDLVAYANSENRAQPTSAFSQASADILRGFGWWPVVDWLASLIRTEVTMEDGVYVWKNPAFQKKYEQPDSPEEDATIRTRPIRYGGPSAV